MKKLLWIFCAFFILSSCNKNQKLYRIQENGLYGFIDSVGHVIIEPQYKYAGEFKSGYAFVISNMTLSKDSSVQIKYGYINSDNNLAIDTTNVINYNKLALANIINVYERFNKNELTFRDLCFSNILDLQDDRYVFQDSESGNFGYKDSEGDIIIKPKYSLASSFNNGKAIVVDEFNINTKIRNVFDLCNRSGVIDVNGEIVIPLKYSMIPPFNKDGKTWANVLTGDTNNIQKDWVLLKDDGTILLPPSHMMSTMYNSSEDVYVGEFECFFGTYYTFIDDKGTLLTDFNKDGELRIGTEESEFFANVTTFSHGYAGIQVMCDDQIAWYLFDKKLKTDHQPYDSVLVFSENLLAVKEFIKSDFKGFRPGKWGYLNKNKELEIPYQFSECGSFHNGLAYFKKEGTIFDIEGYINKKGDIVWQTKCKK